MIDSESVKEMHWTSLEALYRSLQNSVANEPVGSDRNDELNSGLAKYCFDIVKSEYNPRGEPYPD